MYVRTYIHTYIHTIALHCIALHCIPLHCIALHYITLHYIHHIHTNKTRQNDMHVVLLYSPWESVRFKACCRWSAAIVALR